MTNVYWAAPGWAPPRVSADRLTTVRFNSAVGLLATDPNLYIGFSSSKGWVGGIIRLATGGTVNHCFLMYEDQRLGWLCIGANANGVTVDTIDSFQRDRTVIALFYPVPPYKSLWYGVNVLKASLDERYNYAGLAGMGLVELAAHFHHTINNPLGGDPAKHVFCSELGAEVVEGAGYILNGSVSALAPQHLMEDLLNHPAFRRVDLKDILV